MRGSAPMRAAPSLWRGWRRTGSGARRRTARRRGEPEVSVVHGSRGRSDECLAACRQQQRNGSGRRERGRRAGAEEATLAVVRQIRRRAFALRRAKGEAVAGRVSDRAEQRRKQQRIGGKNRDQRTTQAAHATGLAHRRPRREDHAVAPPLAVPLRAAASSSATRPFRISIGRGGQPTMCRSTGITALTGPTQA